VEYKKLWKRNEDPTMIKWNNLCDRLHSMIPGLITDFMQDFKSIEERVLFDGFKVNGDGKSDKTKNSSYGDNDAWQAVLLKHTNKYAGIKTITPDMETKFPTASPLINEYGDDCPVAFYSIMAPQTELHRHTGPENLDGKNIRVHVPLIIPKGEIFLEINGEFITWEDIFCFDNQYVHSAYNYSDEWRLIFLIDFTRESIGIPPGLPYDKERSGDPYLKFDRNRNPISTKK
jgi:aspartyl/asparaginyl beta-hydroxylase (cupin superfamily)